MKGPSKGIPKTPNSGRKKGTPNKSTKLMEDKARELGIDPFEILLHFAAGNWKQLGYDSDVYVMENAQGATKIGYTISPDMRLKAASEACQYILPKKKAVELSSSSEGFKVIIEDYSKKDE